MGSALLGQVVLGGIRKLVEVEPGSELACSFPVLPVLQFLPPDSARVPILNCFTDGL